MLDTNTVKVALYVGLSLQIIGDGGNWDDVLAEVTGHINKEILKKGDWNPDSPDAIYFKIDMPCGHHIDFKTGDDVWALEREKNIPCSCGDPTHYFVKWSKACLSYGCPAHPGKGE